MIKGSNPGHILLGSLADDGFPADRFDYLLADPPYGVDWKAYRQPIEDEHRRSGIRRPLRAGPAEGVRRFAAVPAAHDLEDETGRRRPAHPVGGRRFADRDRAFRVAAVLRRRRFPASPEIRRWILENDLLEGIVALPDQMFYNTGINTYVWVLTNRKTRRRTGWCGWWTPANWARRCARASATNAKNSPRAAVAEVTRLYPKHSTSPATMRDRAVGWGG